jgi:hypothetical protein
VNAVKQIVDCLRSKRGSRLAATDCFAGCDEFVDAVNFEINKTTEIPIRITSGVTKHAMRMKYSQLLEIILYSSHETLDIIDTVVENILNYKQQHHIIK